LYPFGDPAFAQVLQHQHRTLEQCSRICDSASGDAGSSPVNRFEDGDLFANVCAGRNAQPAHESSSKIRDDVSVKVLQQQNIKLVGVDHELHAGVVYDQIVCFDIRIVFGNFPETVQEQVVGHLHDVRLMNGGDLLAAFLPGVFKREFGDASRRAISDDLQAFHDSGNDFVLESGVKVFSVLAHDDEINVIVASLDAGQRFNRPKIRVQVELFSQTHV